MPIRPQYGCLGARGLIVPSHEIENFLANGWHLGDEPGCGVVRMFPVASGVNRVSQNHKKMVADRVASMATKKVDDDEAYRTHERKTQAR